MLPAFLLAIALQADTVGDRFGIESILPTSVGGWLAIFTAAGLLIDRIRNRGKKEGVDEATVNGLGSRVHDVELVVERIEGQFLEHQHTVDRVLFSNENLLKEIGKADRSVVQCREDTEKFAIEIGSKVDAMRRDVLSEVGATRKDLSERMGTIEVGLANGMSLRKSGKGSGRWTDA